MADEPTGSSDDPPLTTDPTPSAFPTEVGPRLIKRFMAEIRGGMGGGSLLDKLTAKQLDKLLEQTGEEGRRQHELDVQRNRMTFVLLLSLPILTVLLCFLFLHYNKGDLLREIIALLIGLAGGGAGGFTLARATGRNSDS